MSILVCGSIAYDHIMVFPDRFKNHILPDKLHILNVAFLVPEMRREFGGCAGNIAYNLKLLGAAPRVMATVGEDAAPYLARLEALGISRDHIARIPGSFTAQAFITTDLDDNQITAFHPGAMTFSHQNDAAAVPGIKIAIVAPDGREGMVRHAERLHAAGIPFIFDPGQGLPMFDGPDLLAFLKLASFCTVNDYEAELLCQRTGLSIEALADQLDALIITRGGEGSLICAGARKWQIPSVAPDSLQDPTGCGDAYRAGLLYGLSQGFDWQTTGQLASLMGSIKIAHRGGQNHAPSRQEINERYRAAFGADVLVC